MDPCLAQVAGEEHIRPAQQDHVRPAHAQLVAGGDHVQPAQLVAGGDQV